MRIVINYRTTNPGLVPILTRWTKVSFTYIVVSRSFSGAYSDIWATVAEVTGPQLAAANSGSPVAVDLYGFAFSTATGALPPSGCTAYRDPTMTHVFETTTCGALPFTNPPNDLAGGKLGVHAYIMGFGWDPSRSANKVLAASVFNQDNTIFTTNGARIISRLNCCPFHSSC
jgi:hypothetical protein